MFKHKLNHVAALMQQIALSGLDFLKAANEAGDAKMEVYKQSVFLSQAEVAAMMVKSLQYAIQKDEEAIAAVVSANTHLN